MRYVRSGLAGLLICSALWCGTPRASSAAEGRRARAGAGAPQSVAQPGAQSAASAEREKGRALLGQGRAGEALIHLEKALELFRQAGTREGEASTRDLLGDLYERQGRYDVALGHFRGAHEIYAAVAAREGGQPEIVAALSSRQGSYNANLMLAKIGAMYYRMGDAAQAEAAYARMSVTRPETDALRAAQGGKAGVESKVGKVRGFGSRLRGALGGTPSTSTPGQAVGVVTDTAGALRGPFDAYREAVIYSVHELGLGRVDYLQGELDSARKHFENVLAASLASLPGIGSRGRTRVFRAAARTALGDIAIQQGRFPEATKLYAEALKGARADERLDLMWPAQRGTARSLWEQAVTETDAKKAAQLREGALAAYREALSTIETVRQGGLRADDARTTFLATTGEVFEEAAAALSEMALREQAATSPSPSPAGTAPLEGRALAYAAEALGVVEQGRARSLLDLLSETRANITEGVPAELLARRLENQRQQEEIAAQLTGVSLSGEPPKKTLDELETELGRLQNEYDSIENQIRAASPRYATLTAARPLSLAELQQQVLDEQTALLEYSLGEAQSYLFAVTRAGASLYRLPSRAAVERQAVALREQIIPAALRRAGTDTGSADGGAQRGLSAGAQSPASAAQAAAYASAAHALYRTAVEPAARFVGQRRLLVVADGALNYVPFHALVTAAPAPGADYSTLDYLFKTNETVAAPSATVVAAVRQQSAAGGAGAAARGGPVLVVADPVFDAGDARASQTAGAARPADEAARGLSVESALADVSAAGAAGSAAGKAALVRLSGTRAEAQQIARLATASGGKADVWFDLDASEANVEGRDLRPYRVLHLATHGLLNAERPQFTGLVLSLVGNNPGADGFLRTDEIFNLRLGAPLVMLSACETGLGREKRGEGVIGLTRAFMYAGAPTVGVTLWSVADKSTAELMADFYKNLLAKDGAAATPSAAMRAARQNMIAGKRYSAPFYWAPFVLVGEWR